LLRSDDLATGATECVFLDCDVLLQRRRAGVAVNRHDSSRLPLDLQTLTSYGDQNHPNETQKSVSRDRIVWVYSNRTHRVLWVQEFEGPKVAAAVRHIAEPGNEKNLDRLQHAFGVRTQKRKSKYAK